MKFKKNDSAYYWTPISEAFYKVIKMVTRKEDKLLEFGSSTSHISYRLAKEGYNVTLLDIRPEVIEIARRNFSRKKIKAKFICDDIFNHTEKYDLAWNSGLIQCYNDKRKDELIKKIASITNRMLLFYPDTENQNKKRGTNQYITPGVGDAKEYSIKRIPEITHTHFVKIHQGILKRDTIGLNYDIYWLYATK